MKRDMHPFVFCLKDLTLKVESGIKRTRFFLSCTSSVSRRCRLVLGASLWSFLNPTGSFLKPFSHASCSSICKMIHLLFDLDSGERSYLQKRSFPIDSENPALPLMGEAAAKGTGKLIITNGALTMVWAAASPPVDTYDSFSDIRPAGISADRNGLMSWESIFKPVDASGFLQICWTRSSQHQTQREHCCTFSPTLKWGWHKKWQGFQIPSWEEFYFMFATTNAQMTCSCQTRSLNNTVKHSIALECIFNIECQWW